MTAELLNKSVEMIPLQNSGAYEPIRKDITFYEDFLERGLTLSDSNLFSWTHMVGAHTPYTTNERCEYDSNATSISQATGYLYALEQFFEAMKEAGVYDNSTIIITADHGVDPNTYEYYSLFVPILIKMPEESHSNMEAKATPLSLGDLSPTLFSFVDADNHEFGRTLFEVDEGEERERIIRRFGFLPEFEKDSWTEESNGEYNALLEYAFTGNQETLNAKIDGKQYKAIPIVDSFY